MEAYRRQFIEMAIACEALRFGEFTLKSGRVSPYFFNAGQFSTGAALARLGRCYAAAIAAAGVGCDLLFGPAYKGIPLVAATACALAEHHQRNLPYVYNRKEVKSHGEGGQLVGAPLTGRVLIIDDVITAGTAVREVLAMIAAAGAEAAGLVVGLDRQERGQGQYSAIQELEQTHGIPVISIINLNYIVEYLAQDAAHSDQLQRIAAYRAHYGV